MKTEKDLKFIVVCCLITLSIYALVGCTAKETIEIPKIPEPTTILKLKNDRSTCVEVKVLWADIEDDGFLPIQANSTRTISYPTRFGGVKGYTLRTCQ